MVLNVNRQTSAKVLADGEFLIPAVAANQYLVIVSLFANVLDAATGEGRIGFTTGTSITLARTAPVAGPGRIFADWSTQDGISADAVSAGLRYINVSGVSPQIYAIAEYYVVCL